MYLQLFQIEPFHEIRSPVLAYLLIDCDCLMDGIKFYFTPICADDLLHHIPPRTVLFNSDRPFLLDPAGNDPPSRSGYRLIAAVLCGLFHGLKSGRELPALHFLNVHRSGAFIPVAGRLNLLDDELVLVGSDIRLLFDILCICIIFPVLERKFFVARFQSACDADFFYSGQVAHLFVHIIEKFHSAPPRATSDYIQSSRLRFCPKI